MPPEDDALLNQELNWHALPRHRRPRLAGANAITAIGLAITLVLWGVTAAVLRAFPEGPSGSGMIAPRAGGKTPVWLAKPADAEHTIALKADGKIVPMYGQSAQALVVCFRP